MTSKTLTIWIIFTSYSYIQLLYGGKLIIISDTATAVASTYSYMYNMHACTGVL